MPFDIVEDIGFGYLIEGSVFFADDEVGESAGDFVDVPGAKVLEFLFV